MAINPATLSLIKKGAGALVGAGQLASGQVNRRRAEAAEPSLTDPNQVALLEEIRAKARSLDTGTAAQSTVDQIERGARAGERAVSKVTGGDVGSTIEAIQRVRGGAQSATTQALNQAQAGSQFFTSLGSDLTNRIAQRKLDLEGLRQDRLFARATDQTRKGSQNLAALLATLDPKLKDASGRNVGTASDVQSKVMNPALAQDPGVEAFLPQSNAFSSF